MALCLIYFFLLLSDEQLYSYTNYGMDTPTPTTAGEFGDCLPTFIQAMDSLSPTLDSEFDESLAVPESLSVIQTDKQNNVEETDCGEFWKPKQGNFRYNDFKGPV